MEKSYFESFFFWMSELIGRSRRCWCSGFAGCCRATHSTTGTKLWGDMCTNQLTWVRFPKLWQHLTAVTQQSSILPGFTVRHIRLHCVLVFCFISLAAAPFLGICWKLALAHLKVLVLSFLGIIPISHLPLANAICLPELHFTETRCRTALSTPH